MTKDAVLDFSGYPPVRFPARGETEALAWAELRAERDAALADLARIRGELHAMRTHIASGPSLAVDRTAILRLLDFILGPAPPANQEEP